MSEVKKETIDLNGKKLVIPLPTQDQMPMSFQRKCRGLKGKALEMELFWLAIEEFLEYDELEAWDSLVDSDIEKLPEAMEKIDFLKK